MGCEQCKLLAPTESESHASVIANVTADEAETCTIATEEPAPCTIATETAELCHVAVASDEVPATESVLTPVNSTLGSIGNGTLEMNMDHEDHTAPVTLTATPSATPSAVELCDIDSNILNSTEQLEVRDEVGELTPQTEQSDTLPLEEVGPSSSGPDPEETCVEEPDNSRPSTVDEEETCADPAEETCEVVPFRKKRGTVRINSIRGHVKVARKLSINPGDTVITGPTRDFVQLGGHQGHFHIAGPGCLWKQQAKDGEVEAKVLKDLNESSLHAYVPDYLGSKEHDGKKWIGMEDVMCHFTDGCGMDIKMGTRTFKESEVRNQKLREDLYQKMIKVDPNEPSEQEHLDGAITKLRYMTFRERESSSQTLGFRVEAMKIWGSETCKDFKTMKYRDQVKNVLKTYFNPLSKSGVEGFLRELENVSELLQESTFFKENEFIGTSLLFVYDRERVGVWLIDFGKTTCIRDLLEGGQITHEKPWKLGNYEDGYFWGLRHLLALVREIFEEQADDDESVHQHTTLRVN